MIALPAIDPEPPRRNAERGRNATSRRRRYAQRRGYLAGLRLGAAAALIVVPIMLYVMLTANLTSLNYKLARVEAHKTALLAQTMRQEDRIAKLESRERLALIAARLNMRDPQAYAVVTLPAAPPERGAAHGIPLLGAMNQWLSAAAGDVAH